MVVLLELLTLGIALGRRNQSQRLKDRTFCVHAFSNKATQFHATNLYDIKTCTMEVSESAKGLAPYLALQVCPPPSATSSKVGASGEPTHCSTLGEQIAPLLGKIGRLHSLVDNHIHLQQAAGTSVVGYNAFYTHKIVQPDGLKHYGCSRASKEFLAQDRKTTELAVQNLKARQKQLSSAQRCQGKSGVASAGNVGGDGNSKSKASRVRHNRRQRELYQKRKKAKRAQQAAQAVEVASGAPPEPMEQEGANSGC